MRSSVSIVLFLLLSGFFLALLIGAVDRNRKLLGVAGACLIVLVSIIVFVQPVQLPSLSELTHGTTSTTTPKSGETSAGNPTTATTAPTTATTAPATATTTPAPTVAPGTSTAPLVPATSTAAPTTTPVTAAPGTSSTGSSSARYAEVARVR